MFQLIDLFATLTDAREREALDRTLAQVLLELLQARRVTLYLRVGEAGQERWLPKVVQAAGAAAQIHDPLHADLRTLEPLVPDAPRERALQVNLPVVVEEEGAGGCLTCLPWLGHGLTEEAGVIEIRSAQRLQAQELAGIERALRIYRNMVALFDYSERDALTGLLNRKSFEETFYRSLGEQAPAATSEPAAPAPDWPQRRRSAGGPFWLALIDVDHFKQVNDHFGHQIGDEVLILVARILQNTFRGSDRVYRFGGEEFVVLLRCPDAATADLTLERLRQKMEQYRFPQVGRITISVGLSAVRGGDAPDMACNRADQAVYHAKRSGRNRVCNYDELVQQGVLQADTRDGGIELF
ncbi:MAG: GGDEF domain-containing protein [Hylemonella sp.]